MWIISPNRFGLLTDACVEYWSYQRAEQSPTHIPQPISYLLQPISGMISLEFYVARYDIRMPLGGGNVTRWKWLQMARMTLHTIFLIWSNKQGFNRWQNAGQQVVKVKKGTMTSTSPLLASAASSPSPSKVWISWDFCCGMFHVMVVLMQKTSRWHYTSIWVSTCFWPFESSSQIAFRMHEFPCGVMLFWHGNDGTQQILRLFHLGLPWKHFCIIHLTLQRCVSDERWISLCCYGFGAKAVLTQGHFVVFRSMWFWLWTTGL